MKHIFIICLGLFLGAAHAETETNPRELIILANAENNPVYAKQLAKLRRSKATLKNYNIKIINETAADGALHQQYAVRKPFTAILVGRDGGEKWRTDRAFEMAELTGLIDKMPMRKREVSK